MEMLSHTWAGTCQCRQAPQRIKLRGSSLSLLNVCKELFFTGLKLGQIDVGFSLEKEKADL